MKPRYRKILVITGLLSVLSFLLVGVLLYFGLRSGSTGVDNPPQNYNGSLAIIALVSMFTSIGSAIAFVSTLILSWTKERRERELFAIDAEKKKLENEKLVLELEQMRKNRE